MKVSIITVTLNSEKHLADCINSVRKQNHKDIEHIIIDGKSTDGTIKIIHQNEEHISYWISETDRGMYDAINKGLKVATGDIVGILNSDDMYASADSVRSIVDCFETTHASTVYGDLVYVDARDPRRVVRYWKGTSYKRSRFRYGWMPAHPTFYMRRSLIEQYGLYENHYFTAADYEFMARYLFLHKVSSHYIDAMLVKMRCGGISNITLKSRFRANRRDFLAMKKNKIPFSFIVSILKPLIKIPQFHSTYAKQYSLQYAEDDYFKTPVTVLPAESAEV
ncbi:MAG: glycosyltransferase family 2 protein [Ginsengibacter sp.]